MRRNYIIFTQSLICIKMYLNSIKLGSNIKLEQGLERSLRSQAPHYRPHTISGPLYQAPPFQALPYQTPNFRPPFPYQTPPILGPPF